MEIEFIGENLLPGKIGNFFIVLSFVSALVASLSFFSAQKNPLVTNWKTVARSAFYIHALSVLGIIGVMFYLIINHRFEYYYVWQHSSKALPLRYMLSCFWEGQEGSFLLWTFWHVILGVVLIRSTKEWEMPVMTIVSLVQVFLASMLLGIWIFDYKVGSNPFALLREHPDMANMPFIKIPTYLQKLDGRGLNPLLQNYWMTIHPPTLFLGFASTLIPFAYAIAGLWTKKYNDWLKPVLPWAFFGVMVLGTGILMGGAWAYEALSFGGFWAWDPVENASLVPWLTFVGAAHVMLIQKNRGTALFTTFFLTILTFLFILYSTFLTRSGILGNTSVHAFTDLGMSGQLLVYLLFFVVLAVILIAVNFKHFPKHEKEEHLWSREFWMFIGALVLFVSAFQITITTSIPVINKVFGSNIAPPLNPINHYNSWQVPFAIIVALLMAVGQFLKYKETNLNEFIKKMTLAFILAIIISALTAWLINLFTLNYLVLLFCATFSIISNFDYFIRVLKGRFHFAGSSIAHIGFGLILLGALISTSKSEVISKNSSGIDITSLGDKFNNNENIMLAKGDTLQMGKYWVTYKGKRKEGINFYYEVEYLTEDKAGNFNSEFTLHPLIQTNPRMGNVAEPDTRHFLEKDIYSHVTYADLEEKPNVNPDEFREANTSSVGIGDTLFSSNSIIILEDITRNVDKAKAGLEEKDIVIGARLKVTDVKNRVYIAEPLFVVRENYILPKEAEIKPLGLKFTFDKIDTETGKIQVSIAEKAGNSKEFIIMKAIIFPGINLLWTGCVLLIIGTLLAIRHRLKSPKQKANITV